MSNGWIKLHRQITENPLYFAERFTKVQAWIDMLLECNHSTKLVFIRGNEVQIKRGQSAFSMITWGDRWKWNERTVKKFLNYLQKLEMIQYRTSHITTIITIVKYEQYQGSTEQDTEQSTEQSTDRVQTNNNDKKEKNVNKKDIKHKYGEYKNVLLSDKDVLALKERFTDHEWHIRNLDEYLETSNKSYKNHYLVMVKWAGDKTAKKEKVLFTYKCHNGCKDDKGYKTDMENYLNHCSVCNVERKRI